MRGFLGCRKWLTLLGILACPLNLASRFLGGGMENEAGVFMSTFPKEVARAAVERNRGGRVLTCSEFACERLGFEADAKQRAVLDSRSKKGILNCSRQWGKSTVAAVKAVHRAYSEEGSLVIVASPSERQSREFLRKAEEFVRKLKIRPCGDGDNAMSLLFPNRSRIVGLPGTESTVRGFSAASLVLIDEASGVPEAMYYALRPMRAVRNGELWLMSTPWGSSGFFWEAWKDGGAAWERILAPATECARISEEFLAEEREDTPERWFAQEFLCEFVDNGSRWFSRDAVERTLRDDDPLEV